jgi:hypothetical protein
VAAVVVVAIVVGAIDGQFGVYCFDDVLVTLALDWCNVEHVVCGIGMMIPRTCHEYCDYSYHWLHQ